MAFGIIAIVIMLCTMNMDYTDIWHYLLKVGIYFPLILALWLVVYLVNTLSWYLIIMTKGAVKGSRFGVSTNSPSADLPSTTLLRVDLWVASLTASWN